MRVLSTIFYMLLSILGLSVISLGSLIAVQYFRGQVTGRDLHSIMRVIGGTHRIIIPNDTYERFTEYAQDEERARTELELNRGLPETRDPAARRAQEAQVALTESLEVQTRLLNEQKRIVEGLRQDVEYQKGEVVKLQQALAQERERRATVEQDAATAKLRATLSGMDAGDVGVFLSEIVRDPSQGGPNEAARILRTHLSSAFSAEVLGEMPIPDRQRVIPLLENQFAGVPPDAVVRIFTDNRMSTNEMIVYMLQMNPTQALGVFLRLPSTIQDQMAPQILRNS
ncbi:MAG: hypothetical protein LUC93_16430 [Planctomycetaceae bacterium]|nr:hypothetical protein [Planctomycetaceae bacterium]